MRVSDYVVNIVCSWLVSGLFAHPHEGVILVFKQSIVQYIMGTGDHYAITRKVIFNSLDIEIIHGDIYGRSCE